jgi:hypothetical protein
LGGVCLLGGYARYLVLILAKNTKCSIWVDVTPDNIFINGSDRESVKGATRRLCRQVVGWGVEYGGKPSLGSGSVSCFSDLRWGQV